LAALGLCLWVKARQWQRGCKDAWRKKLLRNVSLCISLAVLFLPRLLLPPGQRTSWSVYVKQTHPQTGDDHNLLFFLVTMFSLISKFFHAQENGGV